MQAYNTLIRRFPVNLTAGMFHYELKPNFTVENERAISTAPTVDFGLAPGSQAPAPAPAPSPMPVPQATPAESPSPLASPSGG